MDDDTDLTQELFEMVTKKYVAREFAKKLLAYSKAGLTDVDKFCAEFNHEMLSTFSALALQATGDVSKELAAKLDAEEPTHAKA